MVWDIFTLEHYFILLCTEFPIGSFHWSCKTVHSLGEKITCYMWELIQYKNKQQQQDMKQLLGGSGEIPKLSCLYVPKEKMKRNSRK